VQVGGEPFLTILSDAGCKVKENGRVRIPSDVVEEALEDVPNRVFLYGCDEDSTRQITERGDINGRSRKGGTSSKV